ncbi:MAG: hypothetical protein KUG75_08205 [Pseudomonadales bacterium]|nr:hypothetical protein [Pseudomonadales bacterium]
MISSIRHGASTVTVTGAILLLCAWCTQFASAVGTVAGEDINNLAQADYQIGGVAQGTVNSNTLQLFVDELLDVVVVNDNGAQVAVTSPSATAELQYTVTNTGNGSEAFRLIVDNAVAGDAFDPGLVQIYLESNATPGLQTGGGGDTIYITGTNDPLLAADSAIIVYVVDSIPAALNQNDQGFVELRAVSSTLIAQSGTDDPNNAAFPAVGTQYVGAGDQDVNGGGNVNAVVGTSHNLALLLIRARGVFEVSAALVTLVKNAVSITDPFGGATLVPGSIVEYQIVASVGGAGTAQGLIISDVLPGELEYIPASLGTNVALPAGENIDDDLVPAGVDNTGYVAGTTTVSVALGDIPGGAGNVEITFQATVK